MHHFAYRDGVLHAEDVSLPALADESRAAGIKLRLDVTITPAEVPVATACRYAGCCANTLYKIYESPTAYMDKALKLMRGLHIPIESVREAISYPY